MRTARRFTTPLILLAAGLPIALVLPPTTAAPVAAPTAAPAATMATRRPDETPTPALRLDTVAAGGAGSSQAAGSPDSRTSASSTVRPGPGAVLRDGRHLFLAVAIGPRDTLESLARDHLAEPGNTALLKALNHDREPVPGAVLEIPFVHLNDRARGRTLADLFPGDGPRDGEWIHAVGQGRVAATDESLWSLALWYTGRGENFQAIAERNGMVDLSPRAGREIAIPGDLLQPPFARQAAKTATRGDAATEPQSDAAGGDGTTDDFAEVPSEADSPAGGTVSDAPAPPPGSAVPPPVAEGAEDLTYDSDVQGRYALYHLKRGEALYSAVVMRFTGRIDAQEVNELAAAIADRSGVRDVTDIPIGYAIRIPLESLLPEYLPRDDARRLAWEKHTAAVARETNPVQSRNLNGIAVILDAGHGGQDRGAAHNGVWEHDYVYDILCRIKARLEKNTGARVLTTIKDRKEGYAVQDLTRLRRSQAEVLLTDPPFPLRAGTASVNLRWYLTNAYARRLIAEGYDPLKIVFISLHADARHPSLGGAMVYIAGEEYRRGRYGYQGAIYTRHREVREQPYVSFTPQERRRSEGLSRQFARSLVGAFRQHEVAVHPHGPVRERIVRRGRSWVPAVLRCSEVPVQVLVEVSNLNNPADSRQIAQPAYRQQVADALFDGLHRYYGEKPPPRPPVAAATGGR